MFTTQKRLAAAIALLAAIGCGGDDNGNGPSGSITLSASPAALTVEQGGTGTVTVTLVRGGGFADPVNVTVTGLPAGVTLSVTPQQLTGNTNQATVTVNVANTVPAGTYTATVTGTATGIGSTTATYTLTVTALPTYTLTATPAAVSIGQGGSGTTTIGIQRTNFAGGVALTLDNPPAGVTGSFNPTPATANQSTLTINVASSVAAGNYNLTVKGSATGPGDKTTVVALTVTPPPDYSLSTTPASLSIAAGQTGQTTVNITRTNFTGAVTLSLDAPPAGITATFNPAAPTANTSTATISVAANVAPGNYNITIKGAASGVPTLQVEGATDEAAAAGDRTTAVALTVTAAPGLAISASPSAVNTTPGGNTTSTITIVRTNLTADVALTLVNPPPGITGAFVPATLSGTTLTSTLTLTVAANVAPGNYPVTVQGAGGSLTQTTVVTVTVATGPSVTLSMTPTSLSIQQGLSGQATLNAARSNYTGNITPSVTGNPAGMTVAFNPTPLTGNTSTVTVNVAASVPVGQHTLTITGASGAAGNPTTTLTVNVTAPSGTGFVWEFCNTDDVPLKFWRLSGGTWTEVSPTVVGNTTRFSFTISSATGGIAYTVSTTTESIRGASRFMRQRSPLLRNLNWQTRQKAKAAQAQRLSQNVSLTSPYFSTFVLYASASELTGYIETCAPDPAQVSKTFNVTGMAAGEIGQLGYGPGGASLSPTTPSYNVMVEAGSYDWMAMFAPQPGFPDLTYNWSGYRIGRNEAAPGAAVNINRVGATAFTTFPFSVSGGAGGSFWIFSQMLEGSRGSIISFPIGSLLNTTGTGNLLFLAPGDRLGTDLMAVNLINATEDGKDFRSQIRYLGSAPPASGNFAMNQSVPAFVVSPVNGAPVPTWSVAGQIPTDYQGATSLLSTSFTGAGESTVYQITATRAWLTANNFSTNYTLTGPTLPGFLTQWAPAAPLVDATVIMLGSNLTTAPTAGTVINLAFRLQ